MGEAEWECAHNEARMNDEVDQNKSILEILCTSLPKIQDHVRDWYSFHLKVPH